MARKMGREYGVTQDRALQITNRVRKLVASPDFEALEEAGLLDRDLTMGLTQDLIALLDEHEDETIEGRWNSLMEELGIYDIVGDDVLLYDPGKGGLDPNQELVSEDGEVITIQEAMFTAWREEVPIEAISQGIRLDHTEYRTEQSSQLTLSALEDGFDQATIEEQLARELTHHQLEIDADLLDLADIEFAGHVPRQDAVLAIAAARRYIFDTDGATREEIVESLQPAKNHPLGLNGAQARAKGFEYHFETKWWDDVVEPGLGVLPDIGAPPHGSEPWLPKKRLDSYESETAVEEALTDGYLFDIAYSDNGDVQRILGYHDEITRPSAKPLHGPAVFRFQPLTEDSTETVPLPDLLELQPVFLDDLPDSVWHDAISELAVAADEHPRKIPLDDVKLVLDAIHRGHIETGSGLEFLGNIFEVRKAVCEVVADDLQAILHAQSNLLTDREQGEQVAKGFALLADVDPTRVLDAVPAMAAAAESTTLEARRWLLYAFSNIAEEYPEELLPAVDVLTEHMAADDENIRTNALSALGKVTNGYPDVAGDTVEPLGDLLTSDTAMVRTNAAGLLGDIAQSNPDAVVALASELAACLTAEDEGTRVNASIALLRAGEADPEAVSAEHEQLAAALDDSNSYVRANACTLIGNAEAPVSIDRLRRLEEDPDERVREQATWAIGRLS